MKVTYHILSSILRILLFACTFLVGLAAIKGLAYFPFGTDDLAIKVEEVPIYANEIDEWIASPEFDKIAAKMEKGDFYATGHGCGDGYVTGYVSWKREKVAESGTPYWKGDAAVKEFDETLSHALRIIDESNDVIRRDRKMRRIFLQAENDLGKRYFEILWLDKKEGFITTLTGPNEEVVRDFENYLIRQN